jgi:hypothetical protein
MDGGDLRYTFRFFRVVSPTSRLMTYTFVVLVATGGLTIVFRPDDGVSAVVPVLVMQAFSAATGFASAARRGYFDLLIARGSPRLQIAVVQWLTSIAPGIASCALLVVIDAVVHGRAAHVTAGGTVVSLLMASTIPWSVTVALPRFSGTIGWLLVMCVGSVTASTWPTALRAVVFPLPLVGQSLDSGGTAAAVVGLSLASMAMALAWVHRTDIPLEAAQ